MVRRSFSLKMMNLHCSELNQSSPAGEFHRFEPEFRPSPKSPIAGGRRCDAPHMKMKFAPQRSDEIGTGSGIFVATVWSDDHYLDTGFSLWNGRSAERGLGRC